jgi:hypothetical protein
VEGRAHLQARRILADSRHEVPSRSAAASRRAPRRR